LAILEHAHTGAASPLTSIHVVSRTNYQHHRTTAQAVANSHGPTRWAPLTCWGARCGQHKHLEGRHLQHMRNQQCTCSPSCAVAAIVIATIAHHCQHHRRFNLLPTAPARQQAVVAVMRPICSHTGWADPLRHQCGTKHSMRQACLHRPHHSIAGAFVCEQTLACLSITAAAATSASGGSLMTQILLHGCIHPTHPVSHQGPRDVLALTSMVYYC
jgi:hypothetical protein